MIAFASIADRILPLRPDKTERELQLGFQVAVRRFAVTSMALQEIHTFTVAAQAHVASAYLAADEKEAVFILKAEKETSPGIFDPLHPLNSRELRESTLKIAHDVGTLYAYVSDSGRFVPYQRPAADTQVRALIAYKPLGDFDEVDLPSCYEDALVNGTLSYVLRLPGEHQANTRADHHEGLFLAGAEEAATVTLVGDTEYARASRVPSRSWGSGWGKLQW